MDTNRIAGSLLQGGRMAAAMSLDDAAAGAGMTVDEIAAVERGGLEIGVERLGRLLSVYGVSFGLFAAALDVARAAERQVVPNSPT